MNVVFVIIALRKLSIIGIQPYENFKNYHDWVLQKMWKFCWQDLCVLCKLNEKKKECTSSNVHQVKKNQEQIAIWMIQNLKSKKKKSKQYLQTEIERELQK